MVPRSKPRSAMYKGSDFPTVSLCLSVSVSISVSLYLSLFLCLLSPFLLLSIPLSLLPPSLPTSLGSVSNNPASKLGLLQLPIRCCMTVPPGWSLGLSLSSTPVSVQGKSRLLEQGWAETRSHVAAQLPFKAWSRSSSFSHRTHYF